jgi:mannosyltransferase OCH1-like enzyme
MIEKNIFQSWYTKDLHPLVQGKINGIKKINPEYSYHLYNDTDMDNFVNEHFVGVIAECYNKLNIIVAKVDFWRYLVLYKYGGVYLDMDIICKKNLNNFLHYDLVLAKSTTNIVSYFTNGFYMVIPNHPFFKFCIDKLPEYTDSFQYFGKHLYVMNSTGPLFLTKMVHDYGTIPNSYILTKNEFIKLEKTN